MTIGAQRASRSGPKALARTGVVVLALMGFILALRAEPAADDWVRIENGHFTLHGKPWVAKGVNYIGSWRHKMTIDAGPGLEHFTLWAMHHDFDPATVAADFDFLRAQLNATAVRIPLPSKRDFDSLVRYHAYAPWFDDSGAITETYRRELASLAQTAYSHGVRIQFCLLWSVGDEIAKDPDAFAPGAAMDRFYAEQVRSVAEALKDSPGVFAYSIGNEVLVRWPINGTHSSAFEGVAANFQARRIADLRAHAPKQLITEDEGIQVLPGQWSSPGPEFAKLLKDAKGASLSDLVDYFGSHFYPFKATSEDLGQRFEEKLLGARESLSRYMSVASGRRKPVVIDEFGLTLATSVVLQGENRYGGFRDRYIISLVEAARLNGIQGLLAWEALPVYNPRDPELSLHASHVNAYSPVEVDRVDGDKIATRTLFLDPSFSLFEFDSEHNAQPTAGAIALRNFH